LRSALAAAAARLHHWQWVPPRRAKIDRWCVYSERADTKHTQHELRRRNMNYADAMPLI
jgi:hypothetical protein